MNDDHNVHQPATDKETARLAAAEGVSKIPRVGRRRFLASSLAAPSLVTLGAVAAETRMSAPAFAKSKKKTTSPSKLASITHTRKKKTH
jgi:hypothetical protein